MFGVPLVVSRDISATFISKYAHLGPAVVCKAIIAKDTTIYPKLIISLHLKYCKFTCPSIQFIHLARAS